MGTWGRLCVSLWWSGANLKKRFENLSFSSVASYFYWKLWIRITITLENREYLRAIYYEVQQRCQRNVYNSLVQRYNISILTIFTIYRVSQKKRVRTYVSYLKTYFLYVLVTKVAYSHVLSKVVATNRTYFLRYDLKCKRCCNQLFALFDLNECTSSFMPWTLFNIAGLFNLSYKTIKDIPTCLVPLDSYNTLLPINTKQVPLCLNIKELWLYYKARLLENYIFTYLSGSHRGELCFYFNFLHKECFDLYLFVNSRRKISILIIYVFMCFIFLECIFTISDVYFAYKHTCTTFFTGGFIVTS